MEILKEFFEIDQNDIVGTVFKDCPSLKPDMRLEIRLVSDGKDINHYDLGQFVCAVCLILETRGVECDQKQGSIYYKKSDHKNVQEVLTSEYLEGFRRYVLPRDSDTDRYFWLEVEDKPTKCHIIKNGREITFLCTGSSKMLEVEGNMEYGCCLSCIEKAIEINIYDKENKDIKEEYEHTGVGPSFTIGRKCMWEIETLKSFV